MNLRKFRYVNVGPETLIYVILFGMIAIQVALPLRINSIVSFGTWSIFISSVLAFILRIRRGLDKNVVSIILLIIMVLFSIMFSFSFSYKSVVSALSFLEIPLLICAYPELKNKKNIRKALYICYSFLSVLYVLLAFSSYSNVYYTEYGERYMDFLTLGYNNPNQTAMYLFVNIIVLGTLFFESKKVLTKVFSVVLISMLMTLINGTLSRTSLVVSIFFILALFCFRKKRIPSALRVASFVIPILFFFLTIALNEVMATLMLFGETVETGRFDIYRRFLEELNVLRFLFGWYPFNFDNLHNVFLTIFSTVGIFGLGIYIAFLNSKFRYLQGYIGEQNTGKYSLLGLFGILIYMSAESALMVSGGAFAVMFVSVYLLSISGEQID